MQFGGRFRHIEILLLTGITPLLERPALSLMVQSNVQDSIPKKSAISFRVGADCPFWLILVSAVTSARNLSGSCVQDLDSPVTTSPSRGEYMPVSNLHPALLAHAIRPIITACLVFIRVPIRFEVLRTNTLLTDRRPGPPPIGSHPFPDPRDL